MQVIVPAAEELSHPSPAERGTPFMDTAARRGLANQDPFRPGFGTVTQNANPVFMCNERVCCSALCPRFARKHCTTTSGCA